MSDTPICIVGNLTADPELRFTPSGAAVANFTIASTPQRYNKQTSQWEDQETLFMRCSVWREQGENLCESLHRGDRVIAVGELVSRSWEKDGQKQTVMEMQVDEVGPSLRYATAQVTKAQRQQPAQQSQGGPRQQADPWSQPQQQGQGGWGGQQNEEAPF